MQKRMLGKSGIAVSTLALGTNVFGWTVNQETAFKILDAFVAAGQNLVDTADVYSRWVAGNKGGESESIIGKWLASGRSRSSILIATKVGKEMGPDKKGLSKKYIKIAVEDSLKRLQTDYIDLYQSHDDDPNTPIEESLLAYAELVKEGKVRAIGASNFTPQRLAESLQISNKLDIPCYESLQPLYNLYDREGYEKNLEKLCIEKEISVIPYYSLASGFLTGKYRSENDLSKSPRGKGNNKYLNERGFKILAALDEVSAEYKTNPSSLSLAWLIARRSVTAPIASATSVEQLNALVEATNLVLDKEAIEKLNDASAY